jgi:hypothetical protein
VKLVLRCIARAAPATVRRWYARKARLDLSALCGRSREERLP